ncbi:MAG: tRNA (adenosine(37)-N6)-dimethylallyltransferase MiaA [Candidatus Dormibacteraeota bacterium]|nr:tRNA (adenosine(37)-N6)-dimethylallyltransferase MiaA [Candidatus Dormibacteraeota bacterium]
MKKVPAILGPTAVGKSKVAFELAQALDYDVLVADSRQVYRRLEIATNKPLPEDRARVIYHGIDLVDPELGFNVHQYIEAVAPHLRANRGVIVEGGSNLYVDALLDGLTLGGVPPRPERRAELDKLALDELAALARRLDPDVTLDFANRVRLVRAIEVLEVAGPPLSRLRGRVRPPWTGVRIGLRLPLEELHARIEARCAEQLKRGLVEETQEALAAGVPARSQALTGTGYAEAVAHLEGRISRAELPDLMARNNRRLAKRQLTWLRRDPRIRWFEAAGNSLPAILIYLKDELA